ncbi:Probable serine/threonine-protein kinase PknB [Mycobacteroides abscessus]|nr:Probable serine/threonine-protein kinase PknB [Mycobacteroides abscessus]
MISKTGAVKVMDFGIARAVSDAGNSVTQSSPASLLSWATHPSRWPTSMCGKIP